MVCVVLLRRWLDSKAYMLIILADLIRKSNGIEGSFPFILYESEEENTKMTDQTTTHEFQAETKNF